jgi:hypothetical protein
MDRKLLKLPFVVERAPDWICPTCEKGVLRFKTGTFFSEELVASRDHSHEAWEPDWIRYVYSGLLVCTNDQCKEVVATGGKGSVDGVQIYDGNGAPDLDWLDHFRPTYFLPHLKLFPVPKQCPEEVASHVARSFGIFFAEPQGAANCVRMAVEALLTELKVPRFTKVAGKQKLISLHQRIGLLPPKYGSLKDMIYAIKWLGNAGSHDGDPVSMDDVMDSYELLEHILEEVYAPKTEKLKKLAKKVNKKKGPIS